MGKLIIYLTKNYRMVDQKPDKEPKIKEIDIDTEKAIKVDYKIESIIGKGSFATVRKDKNHYCLVMELMCGGELFDHIIEQETFNEERAQSIMAPVFDAVIYCHERDIIHRDIKPENLLLSGKDLSDSIIKISDFGLARYINAGTEELATTTCGTPGYVASEILNKKPYDHRCDYWSLAVVLFIMLSGTPPFYHEDNFELFELIKQGKYDYDAPAWKSISTEAKDLI